jgi:hypothetical protein
MKVPPRWNTADGSIDMYYWFWGTLAMSRVGGEQEKAWRKSMKEVLARSQRRDGGRRGSWDPAGAWGPEGGRVYSTAIMTLVSELTDSMDQVERGRRK